MKRNLGHTSNGDSWLPAGTHDAAQPAHRQQQHTARALAARRPDTARGPAAGPFPTLPPPPLHLNTLGHGPRSVRARPCPEPRHAATARPPSPASRSKKRRRESTIWCRLAPPTPYTCSTVTQRSPRIVSAMGRCMEGLRALPHRSETLQRLCSGRNGKPFRAPPTTRASRPDTTRRPSQRSPTRLRPATPQPTHHASIPGPGRLSRALVPTVDPLLHPLLVAGIARARLPRPATAQISAS